MVWMTLGPGVVQPQTHLLFGEDTIIKPPRYSGMP